MAFLAAGLPPALPGKRPSSLLVAKSGNPPEAAAARLSAVRIRGVSLSAKGGVLAQFQWRHATRPGSLGEMLIRMGITIQGEVREGLESWKARNHSILLTTNASRVRLRRDHSPRTNPASSFTHFHSWLSSHPSLRFLHPG
jgi:hypothetical protein